MRIAYIAAGAAGSYCGACARDVRICAALREAGCDAVVFPLYTPLRADGHVAGPHRVFYGAINVYLQHRLSLFRRTPRSLDALLDAPLLLRAVSRLGVETRPEELGEMTVSVLRGPDGRQRKELEKLTDYLAGNGPWDVVNLSNSLLSGILPGLRSRLDVPVVCNLQGEDDFVRRLPEPHRGRAQALMREHARSVDTFVASFPGYADTMATFLDVPRERIHIVPPGLPLDGRAEGTASRPDGSFRIAFFSRIIPRKGLDLLCEAFCRLASEEPPGALRAVLAVGGQLTHHYSGYWKSCRRLLTDRGLGDRLELLDNPDAAARSAFLRGCDVFCVPSRQHEPTAMAWLEALEAGLPLVAPRRPCLDELVRTSGAGVLVPPDDPQALARTLARLRDNRQETERLSRAARRTARVRFAAGKAARATAALYREAAATDPGPERASLEGAEKAENR